MNEGLKKARAHYNQIRKNLRLAKNDHSLDAQRMVDIHQELCRIQPEAKNLGYVYYDLGHLFIKEHLVDVIRKEHSLTEEEEKNIRNFIGREYYAPSARDFRNRLAAGKNLAKNDKGKKILNMITAESKKLLNEQAEQQKIVFEKSREYIDLFGNIAHAFAAYNWEALVEMYER